MQWVQKTTLAGPDLQRARSGHIVGVAHESERAHVVVAIETGNGELVAVCLTPMQCVNLKIDIYQAIEANKKDQSDIEGFIAEIEGGNGYTQRKASE